MQGSKVLIGILAVAGVVGIAYLFTRGSHTSNQPAALLSSREANLGGWTPLHRQLKEYNNTETWDIDWGKDGLPVKVVITRNATET